MLVIYDFGGARCFAEASDVLVNDAIISVSFTGTDKTAALDFGEGWTKDEAVKSIEAQLYDEVDGLPVRQTILYLVDLQQPYPKPIPF